MSTTSQEIETITIEELDQRAEQFATEMTEERPGTTFDVFGSREAAKTAFKTKFIELASSKMNIIFPAP